jgi:hypothetical protein
VRVDRAAPPAVETSRAKLLGRYMADAEKNTEEMLEGALGGPVFFDEMHTLHERGYRQGGPYGNAIINTLLLYMENHRDELACSGPVIPRRWIGCRKSIAACGGAFRRDRVLATPRRT